MPTQVIIAGLLFPVPALASEHGIYKARLSGHGVSYLAPVASNQSEDGRALNRRVELVEN